LRHKYRVHISFVITKQDAHKSVCDSDNFNNAVKTRSDIFMEDCRHTHCIGSNLTISQDRAADMKQRFVAVLLLKYVY